MRPSCPLWSSILNLWITLRISPRGSLGVRLSRRRGIMQTRINRTTEHTKILLIQTLRLRTQLRVPAMGVPVRLPHRDHCNQHAATSLEMHGQPCCPVLSLPETSKETSGTTPATALIHPTAICRSMHATTQGKFARAMTAAQTARMKCRQLLHLSGTHSRSHQGCLRLQTGRT